MAFPKAAFVLAVVIAGGVGALAFGGGRVGAPGGEATSAPMPMGASGHPVEEEARAVAAVRAHLREARASADLSGVVLHAAGQPDEVAVCGTLEGQPVVARVLLYRADAAAIAVAVRDGRAPPQARAPMVILEAGPGLPRFTTMGGPWDRYCRGPQPAPALVPAEVMSALPVVEQVAEPGAQGRVAVISPVRVRAGPSGSAEILMTAQRGQVLTVHAEAAGGWLQVGEDGAPLGWAHSSLLGPAP
ncbi:SH3 domain-containing protein [Falsiroseomonas sp. E2-1-a20]|uniref:SH3 domain-containing protein n=1 Tax=Falsiroseomonas sp. E2-1-a20 TaxID=3239300 RepID=UPI003F3762AC